MLYVQDELMVMAVSHPYKAASLLGGLLNRCGECVHACTPHPKVQGFDGLLKHY